MVNPITVWLFFCFVFFTPQVISMHGIFSFVWHQIVARCLRLSDFWLANMALFEYSVYYILFNKFKYSTWLYYTNTIFLTTPFLLLVCYELIMPRKKAPPPNQYSVSVGSTSTYWNKSTSFSSCRLKAKMTFSWWYLRIWIKIITSGVTIQSSHSSTRITILNSWYFAQVDGI